ncbi:hypothetical protein [Niallia endozanthoxylica]|uniref:Uncharacterized protein n=1 Tax=Niallia endozanthoxylica TaxID=2036016 RepID=A0A5J5HZC8_9BACI|nr:hypothetical protein [Niallia endozanthoxylica]KAA9027559.1 hypothetical protein F4V44_06050 [Niallia endozanthoxylica]
MIAYFVDFLLIALLVIGITAINGIITDGIGNKLFGRNKKSQFVNQSARIQTGWKNVGGSNK